MYELIKAAVFGVVQGLTEFLPVSSSGHLEIAKYLMADESAASQSMLMTVVLHFATALSTVIVFRKEVLEILRGLLEFKNNEHVQFCIKIVVSMIPVVAVGLLFEKEVESLFSKNLLLVGVTLIVTGALLFCADRATKTEKSVGLWDAIIIGISQAIAILPGISRSGATISTSVLLGIDRDKAARFSFLMVVPVIFGKIAKDILDGIGGESTFDLSGEMLPLVIGFVTAFVTGLFACTWMIKLVKACQLTYFSYYCFIVAILVILESQIGFFQ